MSLGHSHNPASLEPLSNRLPWQFRARPALVTTIGSIISVLLAVGLLISGRRLLGALAADLPPDTMLLTALITATVVAFTRIAWRRSFPLESPADLSLTDRLLGWGSSAALLLLAVGCCYPANRTVDWLIWLPILVADQLWRQNFFDAGEPWAPTSEAEIELEMQPTLTLTNAQQHENPVLKDPVLKDPALKDIVQQLFRIQDEQGLDVIYGTVRADFVAGQRTSVVHVGFCPPLTYRPEIEAEALPGYATKLKVVQALAHGTRLDVRLPAPATVDCQVWIDMAARPVGTTAQVKSA